MIYIYDATFLMYLAYVCQMDSPVVLRRQSKFFPAGYRMYRENRPACFKKPPGRIDDFSVLSAGNDKRKRVLTDFKWVRAEAGLSFKAASPVSPEKFS
jgi:hypothetical protein